VILGRFFEFLFPGYTCLACGGEIRDEGRKFICGKCAAELAATVNTEPAVMMNTGEKQYFYRAGAAFKYEGAVVRLILALKYNSRKEAAAALAPGLVEVLEKVWAGRDCDTVLVPVPLAKKRQRGRGYNQSMLVCKEIAEILGLGVDEGLLCRVKETRVQKNMTAKERAGNVRGAFKVTDKARAAGGNFTIVDDVFTSGATVNECAKVLVTAGAKRVDALTIARVVHTDGQFGTGTGAAVTEPVP
jgi:ComF family protein